jgi:ribosomal protein S6--L-glutamate ligase
LTVLSFHPISAADCNRLCAGRHPDEADLAAIREASAVILPQGCRRSLYEMARRNCRFVFPDYRARFGFPGKIGQSRLFEKLGAPHPRTETFASLKEFHRRYPHSEQRAWPSFPFVFKFDWGGEGDLVFLVKSPTELAQMLRRADEFERTGQQGFLLQELISAGTRALRVAVIGRELVSYWRIAAPDGPFAVNLAGGGAVDRDTDLHLIASAEQATRVFCRHTGINLAGFDFLFPSDPPDETPLFLEINYFFGRRGLGGSEHFYRILTAEIDRWLADTRDS